MSFLTSPLKHQSQNAFQCPINFPDECREERKPQFCLFLTLSYLLPQCRTAGTAETKWRNHSYHSSRHPQRCCSTAAHLQVFGSSGVTQHRRVWSGHNTKEKLLHLFTAFSLSCSPSAKQDQPTSLNILLMLQQITLTAQVYNTPALCTLYV